MKSGKTEMTIPELNITNNNDYIIMPIIKGMLIYRVFLNENENLSLTCVSCGCRMAWRMWFMQ
jgi:hypothetical protein